MATKLFLLFSFSLFICSPAFAVEVSFASLKSMVETKNERVLSQRKEAESSKAREGFLKRSYLPRVSLEGGYEDFEVGSTLADRQPYYGVEASVNLFNGGKDRIQDQSLKVASKRRGFEVRVTIAEELATARELFWELIYLKAELDLIEKMKTINSKNLKAANRRIKSGVATPSDRLEFKMKGLDLDQSQRTTSTRFKTLSFDLLVRLGYDLDEPLVIIGQLAHADEWEHDLKHSHKDHEYFSKPSVLYAEELNLMGKQRRRAWMPKLDFYASWHQFNQREEDPTASGERQKSAVGLKVTLDLFDGISARSDSQALAAQASAALAISEFKKKKSEALIEKEFSELKSLHDQVHEVEKLIKMAREYYRATQSEYSRGAKNSPDVLGATEKLEEIQRSKNQLIRDFQVARSHVLSKIGK